MIYTALALIAAILLLLARGRFLRASEGVGGAKRLEESP
jgi:hypothetical protein